MKRIWWLAPAAAILVVAAIMIWRAERLAHGAPAGAAITIPEGPALNAEVIAQHLSAAVQIQTVSHDAGDGAEKAAQIEKLHAFLEKTYPRTHKALKREIIGGGALLYTWTGSDASLPPIVLMAHQDTV